ncbi:serine protease grass-like [Zophobas morio]|uniref:serine protease grass-like n=1 Tax=Zophobas morio TaxID=2755281 RepID=UPI003083AF74
MSWLLLLYFFAPVRAQWDVIWNPPNTNGCTTPDQKPGSCLQIYNCQPMLDFLDKVRQPIPPETEKHLKSYRCGTDRGKPKICCPSGLIIIDNEKLEDSIVFPDVSTHRNFRLLPKNCGHFDADNKIVNGEKTGLFEFPWMALLSYRTRNGPQFKCGGTIINQKYILTAAHCLANLKTPLIGVRVGEHNIRTQKDCEFDKWNGEICAPPYQDLGVEAVITHPEFSSRYLSNDIGLIRVSPIDLSQENSRPVCLPLAESRDYNFTNRNVFVAGWGITERGTPSPELLKVALPVVPLKECEDAYAKTARVDNRQLCAGGRNKKDSCGGDSGGPLHAQGRINGDTRLVQQGIVSFGPIRCGEVPIPGVYTRVAAFMDWILDNIEP